MLPDYLASRQSHKFPLEDRLAAIKTWFAMNHVFLSSLVFNTPLHIVEDGPHAAWMNGADIWLNRTHADKLTNDELKFLLAHEVMHMVLMHPLRRDGRDPALVNEAWDYVVNQLLVDEGVGRMVDGGLLDEDLYNEGGGLSERVYEILKDRQDDQPPDDQPPDDPQSDPDGDEQDDSQGDDGGDGGEEQPDDQSEGGDQPDDAPQDGQGGGGGSPPPPSTPPSMAGHFDAVVDTPDTPEKSREQVEDDIKGMVAQAATMARMQGNLSENMARIVGEVLDSKVDWKDALQNYVVKCKSDSRTFSRISRRMATRGIIAPARTGEEIDELVVAIDCSGSVSERELAQFAGEIHTIWEDQNPVSLHIVYFDSQVCHHDTFTRDEPPDLAFHGGGGTAFSPVFEFLEQQDIDPSVCVVLTDLCCDDFGAEPQYPVLWVSTDGVQGGVPFGDVITMELEDEG